MAAMDTKEQHQLSLKVMRLTKPTFASSTPLSCESVDLPGKALDKLRENDAAAVPGLPNVAMGELLTLPQTFGSIFLGETFSSFINVRNDSAEDANEVVVKTEIQTGSQRVTLSRAEAGTIATLKPDCSISDTVHHEVKELGIHILVCSVHYTPPNVNAERKFFRKFFKFQVFKPLDVKTKAYNVQENVFLEAQLQNITEGPIHMHKVTLQPSPLFDMVDLNHLKGIHPTSDSGEKTTFGSSTYLNSQDTRQYLFKLTPKVAGGDAATRSATTIGRLDIVWKTNMGELGRLQTSDLPRKPPVPTDLEVRVQSAPKEVFCGTPFVLTCVVTNLSKRPLRLRLREDPVKAQGIFLDGVSGREIGPAIAPHQSLTFPLQLVGVRTGLHPIKGILLMDKTSNSEHELQSLPFVFVHRRAKSED
eukprot:m.489572 g.489572  ORF g.489572 m.489572 type:complete len:419 (+) comp26900_c0_seq1:171-1427(+)